MELNSKGKIAKFYMWLPPDDKKLPQDFCTYFWGLVARVSFIFGGGCMILVLLIFAIAQGAIFLWAHKVGILIFLASLLIAVLIVWLSERKKKVKAPSEMRVVVRAKIDSAKKRYCPRIDWK